jgi:serine/threonine-protein kinase
VVVENEQDLQERKVCLECNRQFTGTASTCPNDGTLLVRVAPDPLLGTTVAGKYEILSVIGHGGMGVVYKARHALVDRIVAIKMLQAQFTSDSLNFRRFQQEGKAASRLNHPHVITVYDFGISPNGQAFIVMDFLSGTSLAQEIKHHGNIGVDRAIKILNQACDGLSHAHGKGVVHRDLKPSNIVLINYENQKDFVKVVDFGVAKIITEAGQDVQRLTRVDEVCGSPVYMSPEQCKGKELDARSDIYSIGIVLYETLTGVLPLIGATMVETMSKHINERPASFKEARPDLYIPERLEAVVFKALSKEPSERHQSMEQLRHDLELAIPSPRNSQTLRTVPSPGPAVDLAHLLEPLKPFLNQAVLKTVGSSLLATAACFIFFKTLIDLNTNVRSSVEPVKTHVNTPIALPDKIAPPTQSKPEGGAQTTPSQQPETATAVPVVTPPAVAPSTATSTAPPTVINLQEKPAPEAQDVRQRAEQHKVQSSISMTRRRAYSTLQGEVSLHKPHNATADSARRNREAKMAHKHPSSNPISLAKPGRTENNFADLLKLRSY